VNAIVAVPALRMVNWALTDASTEGIPTSVVSTGGLR